MSTEEGGGRMIKDEQTMTEHTGLGALDTHHLTHLTSALYLNLFQTECFDL